MRDIFLPGEVFGDVVVSAVMCRCPEYRVSSFDVESWRFESESGEPVTLTDSDKNRVYDVIHELLDDETPRHGECIGAPVIANLDVVPDEVWVEMWECVT